METSNIVDDLIRKKYDAISNFVGTDQSWNFGEFRCWYNACLETGQTLDPADFKRKKDGENRHG